jgi:hypothetical protein
MENLDISLSADRICDEGEKMGSDWNIEFTQKGERDEVLEILA